MMTKRASVSDHETKTYNADEVTKMEAAGYITPRAAADLSHVRIDRVYRAMKPRTVRGKQVKAPCRVRLGENEWNRYVHKADWLAYIEKVKAKAAASLGLA